jgi:hypothetical protein
MCAKLAGRTELIAGDHAAAEQHLRQGYEALRATGERGQRASLATWPAEAVYAQGRFGEALRLAEEAVTLIPDRQIRLRPHSCAPSLPAAADRPRRTSTTGRRCHPAVVLLQPGATRT